MKRGKNMRNTSHNCVIKVNNYEGSKTDNGKL